MGKTTSNYQESLMAYRADALDNYKGAIARSFDALERLARSTEASIHTMSRPAAYPMQRPQGAGSVQMDIANLQRLLRELRSQVDDLVSDVAELKENMDECLRYSDEWDLQFHFAKAHYGLDLLVGAEDMDVRIAVAEEGYGLDALIVDDEPCVCEAAQRYLDEASMSLEGWVKENPDKCAPPENRRDSFENELEKEDR